MRKGHSDPLQPGHRDPTTAALGSGRHWPRLGAGKHPWVPGVHQPAQHHQGTQARVSGPQAGRRTPTILPPALRMSDCGFPQLRETLPASLGPIYPKPNLLLTLPLLTAPSPCTSRLRRSAWLLSRPLHQPSAILRGGFVPAGIQSPAGSPLPCAGR